ncbi:TniQ family protein [Paenibacillus filicis]|uniref:TniQ family protein n=1 Tax=Paenibacillus gyeongsangnamensis TaxID=3388067 RepID=A0ABT4Q9P7_9BACL|nr:TniQ family protein [Paenibacillus filicis]MCZ8513400.1 TniQ family protein [Paenibacillus filicis]
MYQNQLLITPKPNLDESLRGFVRRTTEENHYKEPMWIYKLAGWKLYNKTLNLIFPSQVIDFDIPKEVFRLEGEEIKKMILGFRISENYFELPHNMQFLFRQFGSCLTRPRICPLCLGDRNIHSLLWELSLFVACPIHKCLLIEECEKCEKLINPVKFDFFRCECGFDFKNSNVIKVHGELSNYLMERLLGSSKSESNEVLGQLSLENLYYLLIFSVRWVNGGNGKKHSHASQPLKNGNLYTACERAFQIYENWPISFYKLIDESRLLALSGIAKRNLKHMIKSSYFDNFLGLTGFDFIELVLEEYLQTYWTSGFINKDNNKIKLIDIPRKKSKKGISGKEAVRLLGLSQEQVRRIIEKEILTPIVDCKIEGKAEYSFNEEDIIDFIRQIEGRCSSIHSDSLISFRDATKLCFTYDLDLTDFLVMLQLGIINPSQIDSFALGLNKFYFDVNELSNILLGDFLRCEDISKDLGVKHSSVLRWVNNGFIKVSKVNKKNRQLINMKDYFEFKNNYIPAVEIVKTGITKYKSTEKLLRELKKSGITPVNEKIVSDDLYLLKRTSNLEQFILENKA